MGNDTNLVGRPTEYTEEIANEICSHISEGGTLTSYCRGEDKPRNSTVYQWLDKHPKFAEDYARARKVQAFSIFDRGMDQLREVENERHSHAVIAARKAIADYSKWYVSKIAPKVFGDKTTIEHEGSLGIKVDVSVSRPPRLDRDQWLQLYGEKKEDAESPKQIENNQQAIDVTPEDHRVGVAPTQGEKKD